MNLTSEQVAELRRLAGAATPGPWFQNCTPPGPCAACCYSEEIRSSASYPNEPVAYRARLGRDGRPRKAQKSFADAVYIAAANPATILALLAERETILARVAELERLIHGVVWQAPNPNMGGGTAVRVRVEYSDGDTYDVDADAYAALAGANGGKSDSQFKPIKDFTCAIHEYDLHGTKCVHCGHVQG